MNRISESRTNRSSRNVTVALLRRSISEFQKTRRNIRRIRHLAKWHKLRILAKSLLSEKDLVKLKEPWSVHETHQGLSVRQYKDYDQYVAHQQAKLKIAELSHYDSKFGLALSERLQHYRFLVGTRVLCLGARMGTEVKAFLDLGCFAVGIDVNPGEGNRFVVYGDFHKVQYPACSVDVIFTNALDHALYVEQVVSEASRILVKQGRFIVEAVKGSEEGEQPGGFESLYWSKVDSLIAIISASGFELQNRQPFDYPWRGDHLCFVKRD